MTDIPSASIRLRSAACPSREPCKLLATLIVAAVATIAATTALPARPASAATGVPGFVENRGQLDEAVSYYAPGARASVFFTAEAVVLDLYEEVENADVPPHPRDRFLQGKDLGQSDHAAGSPSPRACAVWVRFEDANPSASIEARGVLPTRFNYFLGTDASKWQTDVPAYGEVVYHDLWPGIDLIYRLEAGRFTYEVVAAPGANLDQVRFQYAGADRVTPEAMGSYRIDTPLGSLIDQRPNGVERAGAFAWLNETGGAGSESPSRDDPSWLLWSTFMGGTGLSDEGWDVEFDSSGRPVVAGSTRSSDFPHTAGSYDPTFNGGPDGFIAKLSADGSSMVWGTFLGGSNLDWADTIELDGSGNIVMAGTTRSNNFPTTPGAYDRTYNGGFYGDVFVAKLSAAGNALMWATYLGGSEAELGENLALDAWANPVVGGSTSSTDFPSTLGAYDRTKYGTAPNAYDAYVTKLNSSGTALLWSTFLGASGDDWINALTLDAAANPIVTGSTDSPGFPTTPGAYDRTLSTGGDVFVTKLNASGSALHWSTFIGGNDGDAAAGVALASGGKPVVTGKTRSNNYPTTTGAYDRTHNGDWDVFVSQLSADASTLEWSTYVGGSVFDSGEDIAVDHLGYVWVVGQTMSSTYPTTPDAYDQTFNTGGSFPYDAMITKLTPSGSALDWSTFFGGAVGWDVILSVDFGPSGNLIVTGWTGSTDFPTTPGAFDVTYNGGTFDAFVAKFRRTPAVLHAKINVNPPYLDLWHSSVLQDSLLCSLITLANSGNDDLMWKFKEITPGSLRVYNGPTIPIELRLAEGSASYGDATRPGGGTPLVQPPQVKPPHEHSHLLLPKGAHDSRAGAGVQRGSGGPDDFGYTWIDNAEPGGPAYDWQDIQSTGTEVFLGDDDFIAVDLPFAFPFYGVTQTGVKICSNGYLTFGPEGTVFNNQPIPDPAEPNDLIALFWDDLNPLDGGWIHYYHDALRERFIVQYTEMPRWAGDGWYTMQVILNPMGTILLQYAVMEGEQTNGTIGIENADASIGLPVVFNAPYVHDGLAILIQDALPWLVEIPASGVIPPGGWQDVECCVDVTGLEPGLIEAELLIESNDPTQPMVAIPVILNVLEPVPQIDVAPPSLVFEIPAGEYACDLTNISSVGGEWLLWWINEMGIVAGDGRAEGSVAQLHERGWMPVSPDPAVRAAVESRIAAPTAAELPSLHLELEKDEPDPRSGEALARGAGGPDGYGYRWIDSDEPGGPSFVWHDITAVGTPVVLADDDFIEVPLPFPFPFYGFNRPAVNICSNGYLTFGPDGTVFNNQPIPDPTVPNDVIAPFWDDLNPPLGGTIHYHHDADAHRFIVQYTDIQHFGGTGTYTFQVILGRNGRMLFQYLSMGGELASATIGIEDPLALTGLAVVFNAPYVHDELAILIEDNHPWLIESPSLGLLPPVAGQYVDVCVDATGLEPGVYEGPFFILSTDPGQPEIPIPVTLIVQETTGIGGSAEQTPAMFRVYWSSPNPFHYSTTIRYDLPEPTQASLRVYDVTGRLVRVLMDADFAPAGQHAVLWDGKGDNGQPVGSGVYFYRLEAGQHRDIGRLVLLK